MTNDRRGNRREIAIGVFGIFILLAGVMAYAVWTSADEYEPALINRITQEQLADQDF